VPVSVPVPVMALKLSGDLSATDTDTDTGMDAETKPASMAERGPHEPLQAVVFRLWTG